MIRFECRVRVGKWISRVSMTEDTASLEPAASQRRSGASKIAGPPLRSR
jgi:hypothetical protein